MKHFAGPLLLTLIGLCAFAQRPRTLDPIRTFPSESSLPPLAPIPPLGNTPRPQSAWPGFHRPRWSPYFFPSYVGYDGAIQAAPNVVVVQTPPPAPAQTPSPEPPPPPPKLDIRDYRWEESAAITGSVFVIALRDGTDEAAEAVWVQDGTLHFATPRGKDRALPLRLVDRERTERLNRERGLRLRLPPGD